MSDYIVAKIEERLNAARDRKIPWTATMTPAELLIARSHGIRPIATVSATCWMHYGFSWTLGHAEGWETALRRLKSEAVDAGANAVVDVKMRTIQLNVDQSMDFTLVGTAVRVDGLEASEDPIVATCSALEFVRLLDADVVPTGIAVGAHYEWWADYQGLTNLAWWGNVESEYLSGLFDHTRKMAHADLRRSLNENALGNGALAHVTFSQMFQFERDENNPARYLARHIVVATVVHRGTTNSPLPDVNIAVDLHAGKSPLRRHSAHHQSYAGNDEEGAI